MIATVPMAMSLTSTSGTPRPLNVTPCTSVNGDVGQPNLEAVDRLLGPIQEELNEKAEIAMLPSPPFNSPQTFSPVPSVRVKRGRGFSLLNDRLNGVRPPSDYTPSNGSVVMSSKADDNESLDDGSSVGDRPTGNKSSPKQTRHKVVTSLNIPTPGDTPENAGFGSLNERLEQYIQFTSQDLPVTGSVEAVEAASSSTQAVPTNDGSHTRGDSFDTIKPNQGSVVDGNIGGTSDSKGVTENSTWAEELEDSAERIFLRLEQLACDDYQIDSQLSMADHYLQRLQRLLASDTRRFKLKVSHAVAAGSEAASVGALTEVPEEHLTASGSEAAGKVAME